MALTIRAALELVKLKVKADTFLITVVSTKDKYVTIKLTEREHILIPFKTMNT
jgi:hypothetical protein